MLYDTKQDYFLSIKRWVKGGLCVPSRVLSSPLAFAPVDQREREKDKRALPLRLGNVCVCLCVSVCVTCADSVSALTWGSSASAESKFFACRLIHPLPKFLSLITSEWASSAARRFHRRLLPITAVIGWIFSCLCSEVEHRLGQEGWWIISINTDPSSERAEQNSGFVSVEPVVQTSEVYSERK